MFSMSHKHKEKKEGTAMNDIAGLMALAQNNASKMDLPGLLALAKEKGYDGNQWWWIIIILFAFWGGGFGGFGNNNNRQCAAGLIGAENLQMITSTFDRIATLQGVTTDGFANLNTHLCDSIAQTINAVRNQGDRAVDTTNAVSRQISQCCCNLEASMASLNCEVQNLGREMQGTRREIEQRIGLSEERLTNKIELGNERLACMIKDTAKEQEMQRLQRENCALTAKLAESNMVNLATLTAEKAVASLQGFAVNHYTPTRSAAATPTAA